MALPILLAEELRKRGHVAEAWYLYKFRACYENEPHVRVLFPGRVAGVIGYFRVFYRLVGAMRSFRPDIVHGVLPLGNVFGLTVGGVPAGVLGHQHGDALFFHQRFFLRKSKWRAGEEHLHPLCRDLRLELRLVRRPWTRRRPG